ncbi:MAG: hypothetical protein OEU92_13080, partial [Alphaproteobacteria bacterium]|nr:hypothetical protein [Alphaproteobacteria bacterium]
PLFRRLDGPNPKKSSQLSAIIPDGMTGVSSYHREAVRHQWSKWEDEISDLSLIAKVDADNSCFGKILDSFPDEKLAELFDLESGNFHITLYEFLHTKGESDQEFISKLLENRHGFVDHLRRNLPENNGAKIQLRQTRTTTASMQVLADIHSSYKPGTAQNFLAQVKKACEKTITASQELAQIDLAARFNVMAIPMPLHLTIGRFGYTSDGATKDAAETWQQTRFSTNWGLVDNFTVWLVASRKWPNFNRQEVKL